MIEKKIFVYSTDSTLAIVEGIYNYQDSTIEILNKKNYLKSKFFENHSKIVQQLFACGAGVENIELRTNLLPESEIYKLLFEFAPKTSNTSIRGRYRINIDRLKQTYRQIIDSNFKDIQYRDRILEKRIQGELNQKTFEEIEDYSFLCFYQACVPQNIPIYQPSYQEQWEMKQAVQRQSVGSLFGGALTNRGIKDIFL